MVMQHSMLIEGFSAYIGNIALYIELTSKRRGVLLKSTCRLGNKQSRSYKSIGWTYLWLNQFSFSFPWLRRQIFAQTVQYVRIDNGITNFYIGKKILRITGIAVIRPLMTDTGIFEK